MHDKMTLEQFLTLLATIFGAIGSIYVLKSILRLTPQVTARLSAQTYGHDPSQIDSLSAQKAESVVGAALIVVALCIFVLNAAIAPSMVVIVSNRLYAVLVAFALAVVIYLLMVPVTRVIRSRHRRAVANIIIAQKLDGLSRSGNVPDYEIKSLRVMSDRYLDLTPQDIDTARHFLQSLAKEVGRTFSEEIKIEGEQT